MTRFATTLLLLIALAPQAVRPAPRPPAAPPGPPRPEDGGTASDGYAPSPQWLGQTRAPVPATKSEYAVATFAEGFAGAFCLSFLPDGRVLVGERQGRIKIVGTDGKVGAPLEGLPQNLYARQGLFEVRADRAFASSRTIYLTYAALPDGLDQAALPRSPGVLLVARARLSADDRRLEDVAVLLNGLRQMKRRSTGVGFTPVTLLRRPFRGLGLPVRRSPAGRSKRSCACRTRAAPA